MEKIWKQRYARKMHITRIHIGGIKLVAVLIASHKQQSTTARRPGRELGLETRLSNRQNTIPLVY